MFKNFLFITVLGSLMILPTFAAAQKTHTQLAKEEMERRKAEELKEKKHQEAEDNARIKASNEREKKAKEQEHAKQKHAKESAKNKATKDSESEMAAGVGRDAEEHCHGKSNEVTRSGMFSPLTDCIEDYLKKTCAQHFDPKKSPDASHLCLMGSIRHDQKKDEEKGEWHTMDRALTKAQTAAKNACKDKSDHENCISNQLKTECAKIKNKAIQKSCMPVEKGRQRSKAVKK